MPEAQIPSRGSRALARILGENGPIARRLKARIDKSVLWRYASGRRRPDPDMVALVEYLTEGQISSRHWISKERWAELVGG